MKRPLDVALVTWTGLPGLHEDDHPLVRALEARGISCAAMSWDDPDSAWQDARVAVLRSTWNYYRAIDAFRGWIESTARATSLWNPPEVLRWNVDKVYLRALEEQGIAIAPTVWIDRADESSGIPDLRAILAERAWATAVVKPRISAGAYATIRVDAADVGPGQRHLEEHLPRRPMMVQPFLPAVEAGGERSMIFLDGRFSHAVCKRPAFTRRPGDPEADPVVAEREEVAFAERVLATVRSPWLYARVDLLREPTGSVRAPGSPHPRFRVMELEMCEPTLFLREHPPAAGRLADAIAARL